MSAHLCQVEACGTPAGLDRTICTEHVAGLSAALGAVPGLVVDLEATLAREGSGMRIGSRSATRPLPFDSKASEALWCLRSTLAAWVREVGLDEPPVDEAPWLAYYLRFRIDRVIAHPQAHEAVEEICAALDEASRSIDRVRERVFAGRCEAEDCDAVLYAKPGREHVRCRRCQRTYQVAARLDELRESLDNRPLTVRQIAVAAAWLGEADDTARTEARLYKWAERGRIVAVGADAKGRPTYPFGAVLEAMRSARMSA